MLFKNNYSKFQNWLLGNKIYIFFFQVTTEVTGIAVTPSPQKGNAQFKWLNRFHYYFLFHDCYMFVSCFMLHFSLCVVVGQRRVTREVEEETSDLSFLCDILFLSFFFIDIFVLWIKWRNRAISVIKSLTLFCVNHPSPI